MKKEIDFYETKKNWEIQIIPPNEGPIVRFRIHQDNAEVNIYLDCYNLLKYYGNPYGDVFRYDIMQALLKAITESDACIIKILNDKKR